MNLIVDVGNTYVKLAVFKEDSLLHVVSVKLISLSGNLENIFKDYPSISNTIVSSVGMLHNESLKKIAKRTQLHELTSSSKTAFVNKYASPKTLGVDRIALAMAGVLLYPNKNVLIIDAGTCITYDFVTSGAEYLGGAISPGITMRYTALNNLTAKLPLLDKKHTEDFIGNSTETSIHSGVVNGVCIEIEGIIGQYKSRFKDLTVILTGGDTHFLSKRLKNTIFADSKFLLKGLNYLLEYNKH